jgi:hypothetical protein
MSDFMDKNSEIMINKSETIVSDDGIKLDLMNDTGLDEINYQLQKSLINILIKNSNLKFNITYGVKNNKIK